MGTEKYQEWEKINVMELKAYLGFSILMGLVKLPSLEDYRKVDPFLYYAPIADRIARQWFRDISRYLHFVDNAGLVPPGQPGHDKLGKVRPIIDHCTRVFFSSYDPHCECAVDEAMIPFPFPREIDSKAIYATKTCEEGNKGMGTGRQSQWLLQSIPSVQKEGQQYFT